LSDVSYKEWFEIRHALLPLLVNFASEYAIRRVQVNQDGLKLNCTHQLLVYDDYILGGSIHTMKKNKEHTVVAHKEPGLEMLIRQSI
jgi:hypothetical protein